MTENTRDFLKRWLRNDNVALEAFLVACYSGDTEKPVMPSAFASSLADWIRNKTDSGRPIGTTLTERQLRAAKNMVCAIVDYLYSVDTLYK